MLKRLSSTKSDTSATSATIATRPHTRGWLRFATAAALLSCAGLATAQDDPGSARGGVPQIGELPASLDLIVGAQDLSRMRASAGGRALMAFLSEVGGWERSAVALTELGTALDLPAERTLDELVGTSCILGLKGAWAGSDGSRAQTTLLSAVSAATERRMRERLRPAPRGVDSGLPILALEDGAVELSTAINSVGGGQILLSPRGSAGLFDEMLVVLSNGTSPSTKRLSNQPWWTPRIEALVQKPLAILLHDQTGARDEARRREVAGVTGARDLGADVGLSSAHDVDASERNRAETSEPRFFAMGGDVDDRGFTGSFLASDSMILATPGEVEPALPRGVMARLEADAALLLAGTASIGTRSPSVPSAMPDHAADAAGDAAPGTEEASPPPGGMLLDAVLNMMHAPDELRARWTGPVVLAVHEKTPLARKAEATGVDGGVNGVDGLSAVRTDIPAAPQESGVSATLAIRVDSLRDAATSVHAWLTSFAEEAEELRLRQTLDRAPLGLVRVLMISANEDGPMEGYLRGGGSVAWTFVADQPHMPGTEPGVNGSEKPGERASAPGEIEHGPGWWVLSVTTMPRREAETRDIVEEIAKLLRSDTPMPGLYHRLVLRPARLAAIAAANRPPTPPKVLAEEARAERAEREPLGAELRTGTSRSLRWLDAVSTNVSRAGPGVVEGRVMVRMDTTLLK